MNPPSLQITHRVATLTLQRPALANRLSPDDLQTLRAHIATVNANPAVSVLVLRATGKYFCSGYDIGEVVASSQTKGSSFGEMVDAFEDCRAVTLAALHGGVYGGATDLALACDFRVGSHHTEMFMPAAKLGLHFYASGLERYVTRLGADTTRRLFLTAEKIDSQAMRDCGFLTHLVAPESFEAEVNALVETLQGMAPLALLGMKRSINQIARHVLRQETQDAIDARVAQTLASKDLAEGAAAWRDKRAPVFVGQ